MIAVLLIGLLASTAHAYHGWRPRQEYSFAINGRQFTGIQELKEQYSGISFSGFLTVQTYKTNILLMKMQNMTYTKVNTDFGSNTWWKGQPDDNHIDLPISDKTIVVKFDDGLVSNLVVSSNLDSWEVNFIKSVVNQLQLDLKGTNANDTPRNNNFANIRSVPDVYTNVETSVTGKCEVMYEIAPLPRSYVLAHPRLLPQAGLCRDHSYLEVTKTKNYDSCDPSTVYHYGLPASLKCQPGGNTCGKFWKRASVTQITGCGDRENFFPQTFVTSSRVITNMHLYNGSQGAVNSYLNITLLFRKPLVNHLISPPNPARYDDLLYTFPLMPHEMAKGSHGENGTSENEHGSSDNISSGKQNQNRNIINIRNMGRINATSNIHKDGSGERSSYWKVPKLDFNYPPPRPFSAISASRKGREDTSCVIQKLKEIITEIADEIEKPSFIPEKLTLEKVKLAVEICRSMTYKELVQAIGGIMDVRAQLKESVTERKVYRDVLNLCGTNSAFLIVKSWIEHQEIQGQCAAEVISLLPKHLQTPGPEVIHNFYEMVNSQAVQGNEEVRIAAVLAFSNLLRVACVSNNAQNKRYPSYMAENECTTNQALLYIPHLSRKVHEDPTLKRIYITALGNTGLLESLEEMMPHILGNASDDTPYLRASAIFSLKYLAFQQPHHVIPLLMKIYHSTGEPSSVRIAAVSILLYADPPVTVFQRMAVSTWYDPSREVAAFIRSSLVNLASVQDSRYKTLAEKAASVLPLTRPIAPELYLPNNFVQTKVVQELQQIVLEQLSWSSTVESSNVYYRHTDRIGGFSHNSVEGEIWVTNPDAFFLSMWTEIFGENNSSNARPSIPGLKYSTSFIRDALTIAARKLPKLEGALRIVENNLVERIMPINQQSISKWIQGGRNIVKEMKSGKHFHYQKIDQTEFTISVPSELGFPTSFQISVPHAIKIEGDAKLDQKYKYFHLNLSAMYSAHLISELSFFTAFDDTNYVAGANRLCLFRLPPLKLSLDYDATESTVKMQTQTQHPSSESIIAYMSNYPFTTQHDISSLIPISLGKHVKEVHTNKLSEKRLLFGSSVSAILRNHEETKMIHDALHNHAVVMGYLLFSPGLEISSFELHAAALETTELTFSLKKAVCNRGNVTVSSNMMEEISSYSNEGIESEKSTTEESATATTVKDYVSTATTVHIPRSTEISTTEEGKTTQDTTESMPTTQTPITESDSVADESYEYNSEDSSSKLCGNDNEEFNTTVVNPFSDEVKNDTQVYLLHKILNGMRDSKAYVFSVSNNANNTEYYSAHFVYSADKANLLSRLGIFIGSDVSKWKFGLTATRKDPRSRNVKLDKILSANLTSNFVVDIGLRNEEDSQLHVSLQALLLRTKERLDELKNSSAIQVCHEQQEKGYNMLRKCNEANYKAFFLNHYRIKLSYELEKLENDAAVSGIDQISSNATFWNFYRYANPQTASSIQEMHNFNPIYTLYNKMKFHLSSLFNENENSESNTKQANIDLDFSDDLHSVDVRTKFSQTETEHKNVPVSSSIATVLKMNAINGLFDTFQEPSYCVIAKDHVVTYDNVAFNYIIEDCWYVVTKDCSGKSRFAVLAKRKSNKMVIKINLDNYKIIQLSSSESVSINGKKVKVPRDVPFEMSDEEGTILIRISSTEDKTLRTNFPAHGLSIIYTESDVAVKASHQNRARLCGICGDFDGEQLSEFKNPSGHLETNGKNFAASYSITDGECH